MLICSALPGNECISEWNAEVVNFFDQTTLLQEQALKILIEGNRSDTVGVNETAATFIFGFQGRSDHECVQTVQQWQGQNRKEQVEQCFR